MKVLMVTPYFLPHIGGMELFVYRLSNLLYEKGIDIEVLTYAIPSKSNLVTEYRVERIKPTLTAMRNPISFFNVFKIMKDKKFDIVHAHDEHAFLTNIVTLNKSKFNKPVIVHSHGLFYPENIFENIMIKMYNRSLGKWTLRRADRIIALSFSDAKFIEQLNVSREKIDVIPNAISPEDYKRDIDVDFVIDKYKLRNKKIILYVGSIIKRKGLNFLIDAISQIGERKNNLKLLVVGDGKYRKDCESLVNKYNLQEQIAFLGRIPKTDLTALFRISDVFVLPSLVEGVPTVILEAMLFNKPVIAFDIPEIHEYFKDSVYLVPIKDTRKMAETIENVLYNSSSEKMIKKGTNLIKDVFSWSSITERIIKVYENVLSD